MDIFKFHYLIYILIFNTFYIDSKVYNNTLSPHYYNQLGFLTPNQNSIYSKRHYMITYTNATVPGQGPVVNKKQLITQVANTLGKTQKEVGEVIDEFFKTVTNHLCNNAEVSITKFGVFHNNKRGERRMRNLQTGEIFTADPVYVPSVKFYDSLKNEVNTKLKKG